MTTTIIRKEEAHLAYETACEQERALRLKLDAAREAMQPLVDQHVFALQECARLAAELVDEEDD